MKYLELFAVLVSIVCLCSCKSSRNPEEIHSVVNDLNESCPIDYNGVGKFTHFGCNNDGKVIQIDFKLNNEYMNVKGLGAFSENAIVKAAEDIVKDFQTHTYIDWVEEGYCVDLSIYDDMPDEEMESPEKWNHVYTSDYMNSKKEDFDSQMGFCNTMAQLIAFNYANTVLSRLLPKKTPGPWTIDRISTEYDYIDIYYECTDAGANKSGYFSVFVVDGDGEQKILGGGEHYELTKLQMTNAFRHGETVRVGGEPLFALDFLYKCDVPARYHFEPLCTIIFRDKR